MSTVSFSLTPKRSDRYVDSFLAVASGTSKRNTYEFARAETKLKFPSKSAALREKGVEPETD